MLVYQRVNPMNQYLTPKSCPNVPKYNWIGKPVPWMVRQDDGANRDENRNLHQLLRGRRRGWHISFVDFWYLHGNFSGFKYFFMDCESIYLYHVPGFAKDGDVVMFWILPKSAWNVESMGRCVICVGVLKQIQVLWLWQVSFFLLPCWCNNRDIMFLCRLVISSKQ